jgi:hypothetical protein
MDRSRRAVALGLSAAVWPGVGQVYLGRHALGLTLGLATLLVLIVLGWDAVAALVNALPADGRWSWSMAAPAWRGLPPRAPYLLGSLFLVWLAGMADVVLRPPGDTT